MLWINQNLDFEMPILLLVLSWDFKSYAANMNSAPFILKLWFFLWYNSLLLLCSNFNELDHCRTSFALRSMQNSATFQLWTLQLLQGNDPKRKDWIIQMAWL